MAPANVFEVEVGEKPIEARGENYTVGGGVHIRSKKKNCCHQLTLAIIGIFKRRAAGAYQYRTFTAELGSFCMLLWKYREARRGSPESDVSFVDHTQD